MACQRIYSWYFQKEEANLVNEVDLSKFLEQQVDINPSVGDYDDDSQEARPS